VVRSELRRIECAADNILWKVDIALVKPARDDLGRNNSINKNITNNNNISVGTRPLYQCFVLPVSQLKQQLTKTTNHTNSNKNKKTSKNANSKNTTSIILGPG